MERRAEVDKSWTAGRGVGEEGHRAARGRHRPVRAAPADDAEEGSVVDERERRAQAALALGSAAPPPPPPPQSQEENVNVGEEDVSDSEEEEWHVV